MADLLSSDDINSLGLLMQDVIVDNKQHIENENACRSQLKDLQELFDASASLDSSKYGALRLFVENIFKKNIVSEGICLFASVGKGKQSAAYSGLVQSIRLLLYGFLKDEHAIVIQKIKKSINRYVFGKIWAKFKETPSHAAANSDGSGSQYASKESNSIAKRLNREPKPVVPFDTGGFGTNARRGTKREHGISTEFSGSIRLTKAACASFPLLGWVKASPARQFKIIKAENGSWIKIAEGNDEDSGARFHSSREFVEEEYEQSECDDSETEFRYQDFIAFAVEPSDPMDCHLTSVIQCLLHNKV